MKEFDRLLEYYFTLIIWLIHLPQVLKVLLFSVSRLFIEDSIFFNPFCERLCVFCKRERFPYTCFFIELFFYFFIKRSGF